MCRFHICRFCSNSPLKCCRLTSIDWLFVIWRLRTDGLHRRSRAVMCIKKEMHRVHLQSVSMSAVAFLLGEKERQWHLSPFVQHRIAGWTSSSFGSFSSSSSSSSSSIPHENPYYLIQYQPKGRDQSEKENKKKSISSHLWRASYPLHSDYLK